MGLFDLFGKRKREKEAIRLRAEKREAELQRVKRIAETNLIFNDEIGKYMAEKDSFARLCSFPSSSSSFICDNPDDRKETFEVQVWSEDGINACLKIKMTLVASETDEMASHIGKVWYFKIDYTTPVAKIWGFIDSIRLKIHQTIREESRREYYYASLMSVESVPDLDIRTLKSKGWKQISVCKFEVISQRMFGDKSSIEKKEAKHHETEKSAAELREAEKKAQEQKAPEPIETEKRAAKLREIASSRPPNDDDSDRNIGVNGEYR